MKKKIGPLPLWSWIVIVGGTIGIYLLYRSNSGGGSSTSANTVDPSSPTGLTYAQEAADQAQGIDPLTGESFAQEQAANQAQDTTGGGGSGGTTGTSTDDSAELAAIDADVQGLNSTVSTLMLSSQPVTDSSTPEQTFAGELGDLAGGIAAITALQKTLSPTPPTVTKQPALTVKGAMRAPSGPTKPTAPSGFTAVGLGSGNWEFVPVISVKVTQKAATPKVETAKPKTEPKSTVVSGKKH